MTNGKGNRNEYKKVRLISKFRIIRFNRVKVVTKSIKKSWKRWRNEGWGGATPETGNGNKIRETQTIAKKM